MDDFDLPFSSSWGECNYSHFSYRCCIQDNKNHEALGKYQGKLINITLPAEILALGIDESQGKVTRMDLPFEE